MTWAEDAECRSCGSSMVRITVQGRSCFCCGAGEFVLTRYELEGIEYEEAMRLAGRECGDAEDILPRINTPGARYSSEAPDSVLGQMQVRSREFSKASIKKEIK